MGTGGGRGRRSPKGPARPAVQTKLRPQSGAFPVRPTGDREPGPATRGTSPYVRGGSGCGPPRHPYRCALASGPRGPFLCRPGRRAARNKGAAAAPAAPRPLNPARPARSPQPPPRPRATRPRPFDGKARTRAGTSGARPASPGAALTAAAPGRRGAVGELG